MCKGHDFVADAIIISIPFYLLFCGFKAVLSLIGDYLIPPRVRDWFSDRFCTPYVTFYCGGLIPWYRPYRKWRAVN